MENIETIKFIAFILGTFLTLYTLRTWVDVFIFHKLENSKIGGAILFFNIALLFTTFIGLLTGFLLINP